MKDSYTSKFSNKKLAILNSVLVLFYFVYLSVFIWFVVDFFKNTYNTEFNTAETIGAFFLICSVVCSCPISISLCRILFNTVKKRWIVYTPRTSYNRRRIDRYTLGIVGGFVAAIFLITVFALFFNKLSWTGILSVWLALFNIIGADIISLILYKSYKL